MERLLARLERRFGRYAPGNLTYILVGAQLLGVVLGLTAPEKRELLYFDVVRIRAGEIWRLVTWLAIPSWVGAGDALALLFVLLTLYWLYMLGTALEREWGAFKFFVFWMLGVGGTIAAAGFSGGQPDNGVFLMIFFLVFATLWPEFQLRLLLVPAPVKVKWLAYLVAPYLIYDTFSRPGLQQLIPGVLLAEYLVVFHLTLLERARGLIRQVRQAGVRNRMRAERSAVELPSVRRCAICGASNEDPEVDIRVCDCEKCGGKQRDLCLPHARNH